MQVKASPQRVSTFALALGSQLPKAAHAREGPWVNRLILWPRAIETAQLGISERFHVTSKHRRIAGLSTVFRKAELVLEYMKSNLVHAVHMMKLQSLLLMNCAGSV